MPLPLSLAMRKHPRVGSRSTPAPRVGAGGTGKRAVRSAAFIALVDATRSPTAPRVSDLVQVPTKSSKTRSSLAPPVRPLRRGEFEGVACRYALGSFDEFQDICRRMTDKTLPEEEQLTHSAVKDLAKRGKIGTSYGTIRNYILGVKKSDGTVVIARRAWETMTGWKTTAEKRASQRLLLEEEEEFLLHLLVRAARGKHGITDKVLKSSAREILSARIGQKYTLSLDKWYDAFVRRADSVHGIKLNEAATRQQSVGRAALSIETIEEFTDLVLELLDEDESSMLTLNSVGNADEWWFDINKLMQGEIIVVDGEPALQQTLGERSPHVTVFSGAIGSDSSWRKREAARRRADAVGARETYTTVPEWAQQRTADVALACAELAESIACAAERASHMETAEWIARANLTGAIIPVPPRRLSDFRDIKEKAAYLETLSLDSHDGPNYFILPVVVIFAAACGPDPAWTAQCKSNKMLVATTADGWMTEEVKQRWQETLATYPYSPYAAGNRTIHQSDQHYSNLSLAQIEMQRKLDVIPLFTPGHHTAILQQADQEGGPIQHANRLLRDLLRVECLKAPGTEIPKARLMRLIEMAVAGSHTPAVFAHACERVGWLETEEGKLSYAPMASCDKKLITTSHRASLGQAAGSDAAAPSRARTSGENADALLINGSSAAAAAKEVVLKMWNVQPKSATGEAGDGADDEPAAFTKKRLRTAAGFVASRTDYTDAKKAAAVAHEQAEVSKLYAGDAKYERATKAFEDWEALKAQFPFLTLRTHGGVALTPAVLAGLLGHDALKTCVEGVTRVKAKQANKPAHAALFLATGMDNQLVQPAKPVGYDARLAARQQHAALAAAAAASSASATLAADADVLGVY